MSLYYQSGSSADNNGGTVVAYNVPTDVLNGLGPNSGANLAYTSGPKDNDTSDKAYTGTIFAKNTNSLLSMRSSALVATDTVLLNASIYPEYTRSIKYIEDRTTTKTSTAIRDGQYNLYTGKFNPGFPASSSDAFGNDEAARVTFNAPGTLVFMSTGKTITSHNYPSKG